MVNRPHRANDEGNMKPILFWLSVVFIAATTAFAQGPAVIAEENLPVFSVDVANVDVLFTVTDKKGKSVRNLKREHFKVYEDGYPQTITTFSAGDSLPLSIGLLVDVSGSVRDRLKFEQEAAVHFFESTLVPNKDNAVAMTFDTRVDLIQDFTDSAATLARSMRKVRAGGGTALFDAVQVAVIRKLKDREGKKILVIISDGDDTASRTSLSDAVAVAQRNDVIVYAISTNASGMWGEKNRRGDDILRKLVEPTGGKVFSPAKASDLSSNFEDITQELRYQYGLSYNSTNLARDGGYRRIRVEPFDERYIVRARAGYFAPAPQGVAGR